MKYPMTKVPGHPKANAAGYVPTHILLVEAELRRYLKKGELVHHCDFDKHNSTLSNLLLMASRREHQQLPELQARFLFQKGLYEEFLVWYHEEKEVVDIEHKLETTQKGLERLRKKHEREQSKSS